VLETFPDHVKVVFKHYPLSNHPYAAKAALTAQAAHLQGKFWPVHDELFKHHDQLNDQRIQEAVQSQGLNPDQLERDRKSDRVLKYVQEDYSEAIRIGVRGVPAVFINGKRLRGDRSFESFAVAIEKELKKPSSTP